MEGRRSITPFCWSLHSSVDFEEFGGKTWVPSYVAIFLLASASWLTMGTNSSLLLPAERQSRISFSWYTPLAVITVILEQIAKFPHLIRLNDIRWCCGIIRATVTSKERGESVHYNGRNALEAHCKMTSYVEILRIRAIRELLRRWAIYKISRTKVFSQGI